MVDSCKDHSGHCARLDALENNEHILFEKVDSISTKLWLIIGGLILANTILIVVAAYLGGHPH
jgi:hypothetical protein